MAIYTDSRGREHVVADMPFTYLVNAIGKLERNDDPADAQLLADMKAEKAKRDAAYAAAQAEANGYDG